MTKNQNRPLGAIVAVLLLAGTLPAADNADPLATLRKEHPRLLFTAGDPSLIGTVTIFDGLLLSRAAAFAGAEAEVRSLFDLTGMKRRERRAFWQRESIMVQSEGPAAKRFVFESLGGLPPNRKHNLPPPGDFL